jgi:hypothetical protein
MENVSLNTVKYEKLLCCACLSSDRQLFSINKYQDIFYKICDDFHVSIK